MHNFAKRGWNAKRLIAAVHIFRKPVTTFYLPYFLKQLSGAIFNLSSAMVKFSEWKSKNNSYHP